MQRLLRAYKAYFKDAERLYSLILGILFLLISAVVNYFSLNYAAKRASNSVDDLILSNVPVVDVDWLFIYGGILLMVLIALVTLERPERVPFIAKSLALFIVIRAIFVTFTHLAPATDHVVLTDNPLYWFTSSTDLFFSGHTGMPFLVALLYWKQPLIRYSFLGLSFLFAVIVLLGHLHYSIDVFAAFFIAYGIADLARWLFQRDFQEFQSATKEFSGA